MPRKEHGFTLMEFVISLLIIGVLTMIAIPGGKALIESARGHTAASSLRLALNYARSEAVARSQVVRLCASSDLETCSSSKRWEDGWITYIDLSGKSVRTPDDPILQVQAPLNDLVIRKNGRGKTVRFDQIGRIGLNRSFSLCNVHDLKPVLRIVLIHSGRVRTDKKNISCT